MRFWDNNTKRRDCSEPRKQETFTWCSCLLTRSTWSTFINPYTARTLRSPIRAINPNNQAPSDKEENQSGDAKNFSTATINQLLHNCCSTRFCRLSSTLKRRSFVMHNSPFTISHSSRFFRSAFLWSRPMNREMKTKKGETEKSHPKNILVSLLLHNFSFFSFKNVPRFPFRQQPTTEAHLTLHNHVLFCFSNATLWQIFM